mmetsp:Transcript_30614/g.55498  ORF Transcript_30614/g.55498 Transcript_30614/m.55498 type:complete len:412 (-) Transcript_30614:28-1263(-)
MPLSWNLQKVLLLLIFSFLHVEAGKNFYSILGVPKDADDRQLKKAYKKLAMKWHPDKHQSNKDEATAKFQDIAEAYETLSDPEKRKLYDLEEDSKTRPKGQDTGSFHDAHVDPKVFEAFEKMFASRGSQGFFFQDFGKPEGHHSASRAKQGGPLFTVGSVEELRFENHEAEIQRLQKNGPVLVLFYSNGGPSCPEACQKSQKEYIKLAEQSKRLRVAAVQCKKRWGKCADYADSFPAAVLFQQDGKTEALLSSRKVLSFSALRKQLSKRLGRTPGGLHELSPEHWSDEEPCNGQFCLLLLERGPEDRTVIFRKALQLASEKLKQDPVQAFFLRAEKYPDFAAAFERHLPGFLYQRPVAEILLWRPKRNRFEVFQGDMTDASAVAEFAVQAMNRGTPLPEMVKGRPQMAAAS